jgi:hypothetical protein
MTLLLLGMGPSEILILLVIGLILIISPILWLQERSRRKYWQAKAEDYEKKLIERK